MTNREQTDREAANTQKSVETVTMSIFGRNNFTWNGTLRELDSSYPGFYTGRQECVKHIQCSAVLLWVESVSGSAVASLILKSQLCGVHCFLGDFFFGDLTFVCGSL